MPSLQSGYSRIPIHESDNPSAFIGLLLVKKVSLFFIPYLSAAYMFFFFTQLLQYDHSQNIPVSSFPLSVLPEAHPSINCFQALDYL